MVGLTISAPVALLGSWTDTSSDFFFTSAQVLAALMIALAIEGRASARSPMTATSAASLYSLGWLGAVGIAAVMLAAEWEDNVARAVLFAVAMTAFVWLVAVVALMLPASPYVLARDRKMRAAAASSPGADRPQRSPDSESATDADG